MRTLDLKILHKDFGNKVGNYSGRTTDSVVDVIQSAEVVTGNYILSRRFTDPDFHIRNIIELVSQVSNLCINFIDLRSREVVFDNGSVIKLLTENELNRSPNWKVGRTVIKTVNDIS